ncbi:hypothetical protein [Mesorhizobium metallidurans]|uniref:hypothetical protein n=1 Tax=Mesorhizobium metallidurans TaxID=489722 RepID=UPI0012FBFC60|nr:hypothetical protein [Mesorhizobium metallidurans]
MNHLRAAGVSWNHPSSGSRRDRNTTPAIPPHEQDPGALRFDAGGEGCRFIPVDGMDSLFIAVPCEHTGGEQAVAEHSGGNTEPMELTILWC